MGSLAKPPPLRGYHSSIGPPTSMMPFPCVVEDRSSESDHKNRRMVPSATANTR